MHPFDQRNAAEHWISALAHQPAAELRLAVYYESLPCRRARSVCRHPASLRHELTSPPDVRRPGVEHGKQDSAANYGGSDDDAHA